MNIEIMFVSISTFGIRVIDVHNKCDFLVLCGRFMISLFGLFCADLLYWQSLVDFCDVSAPQSLSLQPYDLSMLNPMMAPVPMIWIL